MTWPVVIGDVTINESEFADYGWRVALPKLVNAFVTFAQGEVSTVKAAEATAAASLAQQWATKTDAPVSGSDWSAKRYALLASASEAAVATSAGIATTKAAEAATSALAAAGSATTATTKATEAGASAAAAAGSATTANTKAGDAAASALAAAGSATTADARAVTANTKAGEAAASAVAAAGSAATASTKAAEAEGWAELAQEAAASAAGGGIKVTAADTTPSLLDAAVDVAGSITKTVLNPGANERLQIGHLTTDGHQHVPATGTTNDGKVLRAGATAGSASWGWVAWSEITGKPATFAPSAHTHGNADITGIDASKISSGTIDIARIPAAALERLTVVTNQTARYALTTSTVQLGDTVKQTADGRLYVLVNEAQIANSAGWEEYTVGLAASVPWSGVTSRPTTLAGYGITDAAASSHVGAGGTAHAAATTGAAGFMSAADKTKLDGIAAGAQVNTVASVLGRTGAVVAANGDYTAAQITNTPAGTITATTVQAAINALDGRAEAVQVALSNMSGNLAAGTAKGYFPLPYDCDFLLPMLSVWTPSSSGIVRVDINLAGVSICSTRPSIDASEQTSLTAATPPVLSTTTGLKGQLVSFDIDDAGTGAKGLIATMYLVRK